MHYNLSKIIQERTKDFDKRGGNFEDDGKWNKNVPSDTKFEILCENKWRSIRHGYDSTFINWENSNQIHLADLVESECQRLGTSSLRTLYDLGSGSSSQRDQYDSGALDTLCRSLII